MSHEILLRLLQLGENDEAFAVVGVVKTEGPTAVKAGNKAIIKADGTIEGWVGGHCTQREIVENAEASLKDGTIRFLSLTTCHGGTMDVYIEPYLPKRKLVIIRHVPIVSALSMVARGLGFNVVIVDKDASKEKFPDANTVSKSLDEVKVTGQTYVVIATMGEFDQEHAEKLAFSEAHYVGIVAGKRRASDIFKFLRSKSIPEDHISKIRSPAGIYIRAVTAEEIALSIMAEIVEVSRTHGEDTRKHANRATPKKRSVVPEVTTKKSGLNYPSEEMILVDPVCGMTVDASTSDYSSEVGGQKVFFCSENCKQMFDANPSEYLIQPPTQ
jgi:xanthine dehydrogenase accessory factor